MMAALFEDILSPPPSGGPRASRPQPDAVILWLSDMPELELEQTRRRLNIQVFRTAPIGAPASGDHRRGLRTREELEPGAKFHFINVQKLGASTSA